MSDRIVTHVCRSRDKAHTITALCHPGKPWSPCEAEDAIQEIERHEHRYFAKFGRVRSEIHVVNGPFGAYLRTKADGAPGDDLQSLPELGTA
jgi:hypothetical protein